MGDLQTLLDLSSRTFALAIPMLPEPTRREVGIAYLLFRVADTFEDGDLWAPARRVEALRQFCKALEAPSTLDVALLAQGWAADPPLQHDGYREVLKNTPVVLEALAALPPAPRQIISDHVRRTAEGMAAVVGRGAETGRVQLQTLDELREYCVTVAGIVGDMLTELFLLGRGALEPVAPFLRARARAFGEGLQLVNILKDCAADVIQGRSYLPPGIPTSAVHALARRDLDAASDYVRALQDAGVERGLIEFTALPVLLARATLDWLEQAGPGAKYPGARWPHCSVNWSAAWIWACRPFGARSPSKRQVEAWSQIGPVRTCARAPEHRP